MAALCRRLLPLTKSANTEAGARVGRQVEPSILPDVLQNPPTESTILVEQTMQEEEYPLGRQGQAGQREMEKAQQEETI